MRPTALIPSLVVLCALTNPSLAHSGDVGNILHGVADVFRSIGDLIGGVMSHRRGKGDSGYDEGAYNGTGLERIGDINDVQPPASVPPGAVPAWNQCVQELANLAEGGGQIWTSYPWEGGLQLDNVPPSCIPLAAVMASTEGEGVAAYACGSACLRYDWISQDEINRIMSYY